jgi:plastocyanin
VSRLIALSLAVVAAALLGAAGSGASPQQSTTLHATVGPGFTISLAMDAGARVTHLDPGAYVIEVDDLAEEHNFHLKGPGVDRSTEIGGTGKQTWSVTLADGTYTYVCDPHSEIMKGSFTVGTPATTPSPPTAAAKRLVLTTGPGYSITLQTTAGKSVTKVTLGTYMVVVRDRSRFHNAHLVAPGYDRRTTVPFMGTQTWKVKLAKTGTLRFQCDPHASQGMKGSAKIVR